MAEEPTYFLIGHYPLDNQASMQRFDTLILKMLEQKGAQTVFLQPSAIFGKLGCFQFIRKWLGYIDKYILFPQKLKKKLKEITRMGRQIFVIIPDHSHGIYVPYISQYPHAIHLHDFIAIKSALGEYPNIQIGYLGKLLQARILKGLKAGSHYISISNATRKDALRLLGDRSIDVVYNELNYPFTRNIDTSTLPYPVNEDFSAYFLHVGNSLWYKNRRGVLALFGEYIIKNHDGDTKLVIVGDEATDDDLSYISEHSLTQRVLFLSGISSESLEALYSRALALLFPSITEGFGWPIIEAAACGCPVITTDNAPMSEIAADSELLIPSMPDQESKEYKEWLNDGVSKINLVQSWDKPERQGHAEMSIAHAEKFKPGKATDQYWEIYQSILNPS